MNRQSRSRTKRETKSFWMIASLGVFSLLAGAVLQINANIHQNSLLGDSKKQIAALSSENDILEAKLSQSNSLENFNQYEIAQAGNYEKVDVAGIRYVQAAKEQFAKR
ncbi:MAG: hypothetical protein WA093_04020 [Minisyncoccales bacterium]